MEKLTKLLRYLLERLQEPSTMRGMVLLAAGLGAKLSEEMKAALIETGMMIAGALAILLPDIILGSDKKKDEQKKDTE